MSIKRKIYATCLLIFGLGTALVSHAGLITHTYNFSNVTGSSSRLAVGNFTSSVDRNFTDGVSGYYHFDQFDPAIGQLTGVQVGFESSFNHYAYVTSFDSQRERCRNGPFGGCSGRYDDDVSINAELNADLVTNIVGLFGMIPTFKTLSEDLGCSRQVNDARADFATCQNWRNTTHAFDVDFDLTGQNLQRFVGTDTMRLFLDSAVYVDATCNSHSEVLCRATSEVSNWQGQLKVTYEFLQATIPEPGTLALSALGLFGLMRCRRNKVNSPLIAA